MEYRLVAKDLRGRYAVATTSGIVGTKGTDGRGPGDGHGPVTQPANASIPGDLNSEIGCPGRLAARLRPGPADPRPDDDIWKPTVTLPAGSYAYKIAINKKWDENYGAGGVRNGGEHRLTAPGGAGHLLLRPPHQEHPEHRAG